MTPPTTLARALWPHQREAVKLMAKYLASTTRPHERAAMVTMPTGSGKTAVMAGIIDSGRREGHWLVIVPRRSLIRQIRRAYDGGLWEALGISRPTRFPPVRELPPASRIDELGQTNTPTIFVGTFQKALSIGGVLNDPARRAACFGRFNAALVDEGHYEPSPEWSAACDHLAFRWSSSPPPPIAMMSSTSKPIRHTASGITTTKPSPMSGCGNLAS